MFTLAHFSDPHLSLPCRPRLAELAGKRLIGYLNILGRRGASHQDWVLEQIIAALKADRPDHVALTGDLIHLALAAEFTHASTWLDANFSAQHASLVPGNHDAYVAVRERDGVAKWRAYMQGDEASEDQWPYLRRRTRIAIIGVSSAVLSAPLMATGHVGAAQLARLGDMLTATGREGCCRVVLIHHPPNPVATHWHKRLRDAAALAKVLASAGAELVLHGHNHTDTLCFTPGPSRLIPVVGVPSASAVGTGNKPMAQYNLLRIEETAKGWSIEMSARRLDPVSRQVATAYSRRLSPEELA